MKMIDYERVRRMRRAFLNVLEILFGFIVAIKLCYELYHRLYT